jgi:tetratricopeptide (TPR) repeat protein
VEIDSLERMIKLLIEPDPHIRPRHADWVARELERLRNQVLPRPVHPWDEAGATILPPAAEPRGTSVTGEKTWRAADRSFRAHRETDVDKIVRRPIGEAESTPREPCPHPPIVGRSDVLAGLARIVHEAMEGHVRFVLLTGPLGIGRTRLLDAAVECAAAAPERVLRVRCVPERRSPLRPLIRAVEALPDGGSGAFGLLIDAIERALAPAVLPGGPQGDEPLEAVEDALLWAAKDAPIVLAIDDAQWGDAHTLRLLQLLVERAEMGWPARLVVLAAARDEPNPSPPLRALVDRVRGRSRPEVRHLGLGPLAAQDTAALARAVCPIDPALEQAVVRGSGGVPYFVVHALRAWCERGAIAWQRDAWRAVDDRVLCEDVPGVADLLQARLASYFEPESAALRAALRALAAVALFGGGLKVDVLFACAGGNEETLEAALETLTAADILAVSGNPQEYGFAQEMVRQAVLNLLRQRPWFHRLHRALLDAVAAHPDARGDAAFLATGYEKLGVRDRARTWLGHAMRGAREAGLFVEAAALGDRLAALTSDPGARADIEIDIVRALVFGRQFEQAKARLARMDAGASVLAPRDARSGARDLQRRILRLRVARGRSEPADDPALVVDADTLGDPVLACEARMALAGVAWGERARALADEAVALAEQADPVLEFQARQMRVEVIHAMGCRELDQAERDLRRELVIAVATSSIPQQIDIEGDLAVLAAEAGRVQDAIEQLRRLAQQARSLGMRGQLRILSHNLATCLLRAGRAAEAAEEATRNADLAAEAGDPMLRCTALSLRAQALMQTGELELALESVTEAESLQRARDDRMRAHTLACRAEILWPLGRTQEALQDARAAREVAERHQDEGFLVTAMLCEALYLARLGQAAPEHLEQALAKAQASGVVLRAILRSLIDQAEQWLTGHTGMQ